MGILNKVEINCTECHNTGKLEIHNAYDPTDITYEECPYCKPYRDVLKSLSSGNISN